MKSFRLLALGLLLSATSFAQLQIGPNGQVVLGPSGGGSTAPTLPQIVGLWTSCASGYLKWDGTCDTPAGGAGLPAGCTSSGTGAITCTGAVTAQNVTAQSINVASDTTSIQNDSAGNWIVGQPLAASAGGNNDSGDLILRGNYWTGSASFSDGWSLLDLVGTGTSPTSTLRFSHTGSPGAATVNIPYPLNGTSATFTGSVAVGTSVSSPQYCIGASCLTSWPSGGGSLGTVACGGVNDTPAIQSALNAAGKVVLHGACLMSPTGGPLTLYSNTTLEAYNASITYSPSVTGWLLVNQAATEAAQRTFTNAVLTTGSTAITAASGAFTQADVGQSIWCPNGNGAGTGLDFHTSIAAVASATAATLADAPFASTNPATCSVYVRDHDITLLGGTYSLNSPVAPSLSQHPIEIRTANNVQFRDVSVTNNQGSWTMLMEDITHLTTFNTTINSFQWLQDGIHVVGPARDITLLSTHGSIGDDFVVLSTSDPVGTTANPSVTMGGAIQGVLIDGVDGNTPNASHGVNVYNLPQTGYQGWSPASISDVTVRHVHGEPTHSPGQTPPGTQGFGTGVQFANSGGTMNNIQIEDVGGNILLSAVSLGGLTAGDITIKDVSQSRLAFLDLIPFSNGLVYVGTNSGQPATISNLTIDGIKSSLFQVSQYLYVDPTARITHAAISNVYLANMAGGVFTPFNIQGTISDLSFRDIRFDYNSTSTSPYMIGLTNTANIGKVSLNGVHLAHHAGSSPAGNLLSITSSTYNPVIGDIEMNDISMTAPSAQFQQLMNVSGATVGNFTISGLRMDHMYGCIGGTAPTGVGMLSNVIATNGGAGNASCAPSFNTTMLAAPLIQTNLSAYVGPPAYFTSTVANEMIQMQCGLFTGSTTGTGTVILRMTKDNWTTEADSPVLTMAANAYVSWSPVLTLPTVGNQIKYQTTFVAGTGGSYNITCVPVRYQ